MKILFLFPCLILTACANLNDKFDCPVPQGGSCKRMDEIYEMVNGKHVPENRLVAVQPQRFSHEVPLWVAPYKDTEGNYHQAKRIYLS
jgi:conjugal transfer pilus assembly protein TraV